MFFIPSFPMICKHYIETGNRGGPSARCISSITPGSLDELFQFEPDCSNWSKIYGFQMMKTNIYLKNGLIRKTLFIASCKPYRDPTHGHVFLTMELHGWCLRSWKKWKTLTMPKKLENWDCFQKFQSTESDAIETEKSGKEIDKAIWETRRRSGAWFFL